MLGDKHRSNLRQVRPFPLWLGASYACWLAVVIVGGHWQTVTSHWPIALAMAAGSYCAGSTPMGGGTVGFPILVLLFDQPAALGRNFSLAIQSIGMVSASIFILSMRTPLAWSMLKWGAAGALVSTPLSALFIAPYAPDLFTKLLFAVIWASFGTMTFVKIREIGKFHGMTRHAELLDKEVGLFVGLLGGVVSSITGVGIDMVVYAVLVLLLRADLKIAIPTSVILMAFTSVVGLAVNLAMGSVEPGVFGHWLAAAPVVALGAPFGALVVNLISRTPTLIIVSALCIAQFVWTCVHERVSPIILALALAGVLLFNAVFHVMYTYGRKLLKPNSLRRRQGQFEMDSEDAPVETQPLLSPTPD